MSENLDMSRILRYGDIVRHFKRELINEELEDIIDDLDSNPILFNEI